uniref:Putative ribonuclease H-like domain-containing protein n=1 Tax=Tanacetum cinerariifolium TaxID=118510 RepID=A0A6L2LJC7_TANCI|nr:putative ribonuclease H-like domain-containing protein [Tanacetum cinerariifolium]
MSQVPKELVQVMVPGTKPPWGISLLILEDKLKKTKTSQQTKIDGLKRRVKKLNKKQRSKTHKLKRVYKVGLSAIVESSDDKDLGEEDTSKQRMIIDDLDADKDVVVEQKVVANKEMFDVDKDLQGKEVVVEQEVVANKEPIVDVAQVSAAATTVTIDNITLAKALKALKTSKPKIRGIVIKDHEELSESRTTPIYSKNQKTIVKLKLLKNL